MESAVHLGDEGGEARFPDSTLLGIRSSLGILVLCGWCPPSIRQGFVARFVFQRCQNECALNLVGPTSWLNVQGTDIGTFISQGRNAETLLLSPP